MDIVAANVRLNIARAKWKAATLQLVNADEIRTTLPIGHPDGTQALKNVRADLSQAADEFKEALIEYSKTSGKK